MTAMSRIMGGLSMMAGIVMGFCLRVTCIPMTMTFIAHASSFGRVNAPMTKPMISRNTVRKGYAGKDL